MGGCTSKPKDSNEDSLPGENLNSPEEILKSVEGDPTVKDKINSGEDGSANENKEAPSLLDLSDVKTDAGNPAGDSTAEEKPIITDITSEIGGLNIDASQDIKKDSDDSNNVPEVIRIEEKAGVQNTSADEAKKIADKAQDSQTVDAETKGAETELETKKIEVKGEGQSPNSETLGKKVEAST